MMTPEERQMLAGLFDRIRSASAAPRDRDAEAFIQDAVKAQPYATYLLAQSVLVQEQTLQAAGDRIQQLEARVKELETQAARPQESSGSFLGGIGKSLFGGASVPPAGVAPRASVPPSGPWGQPAAQPVQPAPQQGGWGAPAPAVPPTQFAQQGGGGGFLKGALGAAAGVAGGMLLADSLRGLIGGGHNGGLGGNVFGSGGQFGQPAGETIINNYYEAPAAAPNQYAAADDDSDDGDDSAPYTQDATYVDGPATSDDTYDA